jgi:hypothetical protein
LEQQRTKRASTRNCVKRLSIHIADDGTGTLVFHPALAPDSEALDELLATIARRIERPLDPEDQVFAWLEKAYEAYGENDTAQQ